MPTIIRHFIGRAAICGNVQFAGIGLTCGVANSLTGRIKVGKETLLAVVVPQLRKDGMHYEVNVHGYQRFTMTWSPLGRFDITDPDIRGIPYELILAVSDMLEKNKARR